MFIIIKDYLRQLLDTDWVAQLLLFSEELEEEFTQKLLMLELILLEKSKVIFHKTAREILLQLLIMLGTMLEILLEWELISLVPLLKQHALL